jgi:parallel beta-helix repeat protein
LNKSVSLIGEDRSTTILDANKTGNVINIRVNNVRITNFTIRNCKNGNSGIQIWYSNGSHISNNNVENNYIGIYLWYSNNTIVTHNSVTNSYHHALRLLSSYNNTLTDNYVHMLSRYKSGIYLAESSNNTVANTTVANAGEGIYIQDSDNNRLLNNTVSDNNNGIHLESSDKNKLVGNNASFNSNYGLYLDFSCSNLLANNTFSENLYNFNMAGVLFSNLNNSIDTSNKVDGKPIYYVINKTDTTYDAQTNAGVIFLVNCNNITVKDLVLTKNGYGIFLWNSTGCKVTNTTIANNANGIYLYNSGNNTIFHNNLIYNTKQAEAVGLGINFWDNGSRGNHWSDYNGTDDNHDGIGDTPYIINTNNRDNYPLFVEGDCNRDGTVNETDANIIKDAWLSNDSEPNFNPNADFNMDGLINIIDATVVGWNWQKRWNDI